MKKKEDFKGLYDLYTSSLKKYEKISQEVELDLIKKAQAGSLKARNKLVLANVFFVIKIANHYRNNKIDLLDLISAGNLGLIISIEKFNTRSGVRLGTYSVWHIRREIISAMSNQVRPVALTYNNYIILLAVMKEVFAGKVDFDSIDIDEVSGATQNSKPTVTSIVMAAHPPQSFDAPTLSEDDSQGGSFIDSYFDKDQVLPDWEACARDDRAVLHGVVDSLPELERDIIKTYYGMDEATPATLNKIGEQKGISREYVRILRDGAILKIKKRLGLRGFCSQ